MSTPTSTLLSWHGDHALKAEVVKRMQQHRAADEIVRGAYQLLDPELASGYKGCLIGCTLPPQPPHAEPYMVELGMPAEPDAGWHGRVAELYAIPVEIGKLFDSLFEAQPHPHCADFAVASIDAVPVGADLSQVADRWALDMLTHDRALRGGWGRGLSPAPYIAHLDQVADLLRRHMAGDDAPSTDEWSAAISGPAHTEAGWFVTSLLANAPGRYRHLLDPADPSYSDSHLAYAAERLLHHLAHARLPYRVAAKVKAGHRMEWDAPAALTAARRWTCADRACGATVLDYQGNVYGSATERTCEQEKARWAELRATLGGAR